VLSRVGSLLVRDHTPFDDGNGRIARAIADMAWPRADNSSQRFYSMSAQIRQERAKYTALWNNAKGTLDITTWMQWFLDCLRASYRSSQTILASVLK